MNELDHNFRYLSNVSFLKDLEHKSIDNYDWMGTLVFYIALHRIRTLLARDHKITRNNMNHSSLNKYVSNLLPSIATDYQFLYEESRRLRYDLGENVTIPKKDYEFVKNILMNNIIPNTINLDY